MKSFKHIFLLMTIKTWIKKKIGKNQRDEH